MKDNREILNEAFFKKASYAEKRQKAMPQYSPIDVKNGGNLGMPGLGTAYSVTDTDEVKKRLAGTFGVAFGNNNVKSMASRAVKSFPIIISDNIEPETAVMLKKLMEEQYAEYINLLISNQVVDLADYQSTGEDGNIAIQALDTLSGPQFGVAKTADRIGNNGKFTPDDIFGNIPLYNLLREENLVISTGDSIVDSLFENACIVPSGSEKALAKFINENANEIVELNEINSTDYPVSYRDDEIKDNKGGKVSLQKYMMDLSKDDLSTVGKVRTRDINIDAARGYDAMSGKYSKLTTADIIIDQDAMDKAINKTVGEMLIDPKNFEIRDRFEKATLLLQSRRISGREYVQYLILRLGIPVSDNARLSIIKNFRTADIRDFSNAKTDLIGKDDYEKIISNRRIMEPIVKDICNKKFNTALAAVGGSAVGAGVGTALGVSGILLGGLLPLTILAGAAVGGTAMLIYGIIKNRTLKKKNNEINSNLNKIEGWERVEMLIDAMNRQQEEVRNLGKPKMSQMPSIKSDKEIQDKFTKNIDISRSNYIDADAQFAYSAKDYEDSINTVKDMMTRVLRENEDRSSKYDSYNETVEDLLSESNLTKLNEEVGSVLDELNNDPEFRAVALSEKALFTTSEPMKVKYIETKPGKDVLITPTNYARTDYAYGSVEYERKDMKDRKYNQPLIMTIKFKERFSDGKYSDNELVAVIGILGKIIRVPSDEMAYILKSEAQGNILDGFLKGESDLQNTISDLMSGTKITKDAKALQKSGEVWHNLEKIATLAATNKITGRKNNSIANAHIVFSQKEVDEVRSETGVDFLKDMKKVVGLMKHYSAFTLMVANDPGQKLYIFDDLDDISWNLVPYSALTGKDTGSQLNALVNKLGRL